MNDEPAAARVTRRWVRLYTRGLPADVGARRVLEIESDLWEHLHDPGTADREILGRTLRGIHADVWWRYRTLLESRGARPRRHDMKTTNRNWWTPVTTALGIVVATMGVLGLVVGEAVTGGDGAPLLAAGVPAIGGLMIVGGIAARRQRVVTGSRLVLAGSLLAAFDPILIPVSVLVVISGLWSGNLALSDGRADTIRLEVTRRSVTDGWYRWVIAGAALGALGFVAVVVWEYSGMVPDGCTEANPCWEDTAAWATWIVSWLAATVIAGIGGVLGLLHLLARHHTRTA